MLLAIPFDVSSDLFRYSATPRILRALSKNRSLTASTAMRETQTSWKAAWLTLQCLERTEYVRRLGRKYAATDKIRDEFFILNLRDFMANELFKWKAIRALLYHLYTKPHISHRELCHLLGASYDTVKVIMRKLKRAGIIVEGKVEPEFIFHPSTQLELIPRTTHREGVQYFLSALKTCYPDFDEAVVLFGDASWGKPTIELDLLAVVASPDPDRMYFTAKKLVYASENTTLNYGAKISLSMMARYVWPQLKLDIVDYNNISLQAVIEGICIYGQLPANEEFFKLGREVSPWPDGVIQEKLEKGYLRPIGDGEYVYTDKAIKVFKEKRSKVTETWIQVGGKQIRLIGVAPPYIL